MIETTIKAALGITLLACGCLTVQLAWRKVFFKSIYADETSANGYCGCHSCCRSDCNASKKEPEDYAPAGERSGQSVF